jgi:hypothetical protein
MKFLNEMSGHMQSFFSHRSKIVVALFLGSILALSANAFGQNFAFEEDRWARSKDAILISDMSTVTPQAALSRDIRRERKWKVLEYETKAGLKGKCISSLPDT